MKPLPRTGQECSCKRGLERDNCARCEGSGRAIDWAAYHNEQKWCKPCGFPRHACLNPAGHKERDA